MSPTSSNGARMQSTVNNDVKKPERAWPIGIAVFIGLFLIVMFGFLIFALGQSRDLVHESYYEEGLAHSEQMERIANANALSAPVSASFPDRNTLEVTFPPEMVGKDLSGELHLYYPAAASWDQRVTLDPDDQGRQMIDIARVPRGMWRLKVTWTLDGTEYYHEERLMLPR